MLATLWALLIGRFGLAMVAGAALIVAWWLIPSLPLLTDRLRKGLLIVGIALIAGAMVYGLGVVDGRAGYKTKIEREIKDAIGKGDAARERALRDFDARPDDGELPDDGFRRP